MRPARSLLSAVLCAGLLAVACTSGSGSPVGPDRPASPVPSTPEEVQPPEEGPGSALAALEQLCTLPAPDLESGEDAPAEGPTPPTIARVMREVQEIRGFDFSAPVVADPASQADIARGYRRYVETFYPERFYERRSLAWQTIGVISPDTSIRDELIEYGATQVIGYYDTVTGELVFIGTDDPTPLERLTLAHELTHAIDDQRFGLEKVDVLGSRCRDEELEAAIGLVEGNATFFMFRWAQTFLTLEEQVQLGAEAAGEGAPPSDVAPFIDAIMQWPYIEGLSFVTALEAAGGVEAIDAAFLDLPVSTEQIIHPERYPNDVPTPVDVPDLADLLGEGWSDLDVQHVGEMWLDQALKLRLDDGVAEAASAGWDGGIYRAWTDGEHVAVVLQTTWDSEQDAREFSESMQAWIGSGDAVGRVQASEGVDVRVVFGSDRDVLARVEAVAGAGADG